MRDTNKAPETGGPAESSAAAKPLTRAQDTGRRSLDPAVCCALVESDRWRSRVTETADGCWAIGYWTDGKGYAVVRVAGRQLFAHRVALVAHLGRDLGASLEVDHACHWEALAQGTCSPGPCEHRRCVNPRHLREVSHGANVRASKSAIRECLRCGGAYLPLSWSPGARRCEECHRGASARQARAVSQAAGALGLRVRQDYAATFGWSQRTAETILAALASGVRAETIVASARAARAADEFDVDAYLAGLRDLRTA